MTPPTSGFFFVADGEPHFGPQSLLERAVLKDSSVTEAAQAFPSIMTGGEIFPYILSEPRRYFEGLRITYRSLAGMGRDGSLVLVLSGRGGGLNIQEIALLA